MKSSRSNEKPLSERFRIFARDAADYSGSFRVFIAALGIVIVWGLTGPIFHFSDTWQLVINTGTTIITFLMVFLIQNTQNRDSKAIHLKLDELIQATRKARNGIIDAEDLSDEQMKRLHEQFVRMDKKKEEAAAAETGKSGQPGAKTKPPAKTAH